MADQKRWWKMWVSILTDDAILALPLDDRWRWVALGCYMTAHGDRGRVNISPTSPALAFIFDVPKTEVLGVLKRLPNVVIEEGKNRDANIVVTFRNWHKYQIDSTAAFRMKTLRLKRRGEERRVRGEEKELKDGLTATELRTKTELQTFMRNLTHKLSKCTGAPQPAAVKRVYGQVIGWLKTHPEDIAVLSQDIDLLPTKFDEGGTPTADWYTAAINALIQRREHEERKRGELTAHGS
jgi:hypothetical protein